MIKKFENITIGDFDRIESEGTFSHLRAWWNILPAFLIRKQAGKLVDRIVSLFNDGKGDELNYALTEYQLGKTFDLLTLKAGATILISCLDHRAKLLVLKSKIKSRRLRKIKDGSNWFAYACSKIKEKSGIDIQTAADIDKLYDYIAMIESRLVNKMQTSKKTEQGEKIKLLDLAFSVCIYLNVSAIDVANMKVVHFVRLREQAIKKMEVERKQAEKWRT